MEARPLRLQLRRKLKQEGKKNGRQISVHVILKNTNSIHNINNNFQSLGAKLETAHDTDVGSLFQMYKILYTRYHNQECTFTRAHTRRQKISFSATLDR